MLESWHSFGKHTKYLLRGQAERLEGTQVAYFPPLMSFRHWWNPSWLASNEADSFEDRTC